MVLLFSMHSVAHANCIWQPCGTERNVEIERYSTDLRLGMTSSLVLVRSAVRAEVERLKVKKDGENG